MDQNRPEVAIEEVKNYLEGKMTAQETADFEDRMARDPAFAQEVQLNRELLESMNLHFKSKVKRQLQKEDNKVVGLQRKKWISNRVLAMAASLALIAVATYFLIFKGVDPAQLFDQYHTTYYNVVDGSVRSGTPESAQMAFRRYDQGDFQGAAQSFETLTDEHPDNLDYYLYQGLSYLEIGETERAVAALKKVLADQASSWAEPAEWYLGLTYLRSGNKKQAKQTFSQIVAEGNSYSERAEEILKKL